MEELLTLRDLLIKGDVSGALAVVDEMEEMSKDDKINNITSYAIILLLHLIKQQIENRTTRSWDLSIRNSIRQIQRKNKRRKSGGVYLEREDLINVLQEAYDDAIDGAALEIFEGRYEPQELTTMVNQKDLFNRAIDLIESI
jgi:hypothetical protein